MKTYLFPGQGSQHIGMGENLFDAFPDITATADAILGYSIKELCLQDPNRQLGRTQYTQPALYVVNALAYRQQLKDTGEQPNFVAGHSLGEYNALESAGAIRFEDGLKLVKKRGELMSTAPKGAMAAIIGLTSDKIGDILADNGLTAIDIANYNAPTQTIISGLEADIQNAQAYFEQEQAMFIPLNVSGAFHSRYMQPVQNEFSQFLDSFTFAAPRIPVIANIHALPYQSDNIARNLADQLTHSVRWLDSMHYLLQQGDMEFIELGPGDVLTKLIQSIKSRFKPNAAAQSNLSSSAVNHATAQVDRQQDLKTPQQKVKDWNQSYPIGTQVNAKGYDEILTTKTQAVILFGHRAAIYMQGYNGYFALDEVEPVKHAATPA
ncbi:MAG: ACP S-malonyltransferase [Methylobacter sp.]|jgi:malonyl CoA-acyl carrier protein transacylase|nr:ACP S-malonyltransferase [Methylobacter sp.]